MKKEDWIEDIQFNLTSLIRESGLSLREISRRSGLSPMTISRYVRGVQVPGLEAAINLAYALDCDLDDFIETTERIE